MRGWEGVGAGGGCVRLGGSTLPKAPAHVVWCGCGSGLPPPHGVGGGEAPPCSSNVPENQKVMKNLGVLHLYFLGA